MTDENKFTHEQKVQQKKLIQRLLKSEEIVGTKCRYGIEYTLPSKQKPSVSLRRDWGTGYTLEGRLNNKYISFYGGNAHNKFFESIFEHVAKKAVQKDKEKIEKEKQNLEQMIKEDSQKTLNNKLEIETDSKFKINSYYLFPNISTSYKSTDIYTATIKNIQFRRGTMKNNPWMGFKIFGEVRISKKEKITKTKRIDNPLRYKIAGLKMKKEKRESLISRQIVLREKKVNEILNSNPPLWCTFYEQRSGDVGVIPFGLPVFIDYGEDSDWYITKIQKHLKKSKIELPKNTLKELFEPMFEKLHFSDLIKSYNGNKR